MNNIDVSQITNKLNIYNTDQDECISRTSSQCERIIFPISKQEESHLLTMTDSRSRKHRLFEPFQSQKRNAELLINNKEIGKKNDNRIKKSEIQPKKEESRIPNNEHCQKSRAKISFKIPKLSEYYIGEKLQNTTLRVNYAMRMNSLINPKSLMQAEDEKEEKKEKEPVLPLQQMKSLREFKNKESSKQKQVKHSYNMLQKLKISQTTVIYVLIGLALLGFTFNILFR